MIDTKKGDIQTVAWSPDGTRLLTANRGSGEVCIWERDGTPGPVFADHTDVLKCAFWGPDGRRVASVNDCGKLRIWDVETGDKTGIFVGQRNILWVAWNPGGETIATSSDDGLQILDVSGGAIARLTNGFAVRKARLSPDGQKLAANIGAGEEFHMLLCNADGTQPQILDRCPRIPA